MARYKEEIDARYDELCNLHCDAMMTGNTRMMEIINMEMADLLDHHVLRDDKWRMRQFKSLDWADFVGVDNKPADVHKASASELLERCRNRISLIEILSEEENAKMEIEKRLEKQKGFIKAFEQVLSDCMT